MLIQVTCPDGGPRYVNPALIQQVFVWGGQTRVWFGGDDQATVAESPEEIAAIINAAEPGGIRMLEWTCEGVLHMVAPAYVIGIRQTNGHTYIDTEHNAFIADQRPEELIGQWRCITGRNPA